MGGKRLARATGLHLAGPGHKAWGEALNTAPHVGTSATQQHKAPALSPETTCMPVMHFLAVRFVDDKPDLLTILMATVKPKLLFLLILLTTFCRFSGLRLQIMRQIT